MIKSALKIILCLFGMLSAVHATTIQSLSVEQRTKRADRVVIASVQSVRFIKAESGKRIYTITKLKVIESIKGTAKRNMILTLRQIGGQIDDWSQHIPGDAKFHHEEEVLVFLRHDPSDDLHFLVGMGQGKFTVDVDSDAMGSTVEAEHGVQHKAHGVVFDERPKTHRSLSAFKAMIRESVLRSTQ